MTLTVVMYHYVRELDKTPYPDIRGLHLRAFKGQLDYMKKYYRFVKLEDIVQAFYGKKKLPKNSAFLTFDDGYIDHYQNVFPVLKKNNIQGCFFPVPSTIDQYKMLVANKIHFILASVQNMNKIVDEIFSMISASKKKFDLFDPEQYYERYALPSRYDSGEVIFIKRVLQKGLPSVLREKILNELFQKFVKDDESSLAKELYINIDQIKEMKESGMAFGSHGYYHDWLNILSHNDQEKEIEKSLHFLKKIESHRDWVMCYPYGGYDDSIIQIIKDRGCSLGFTTEVRLADIRQDNPLLVPRLNTNDLPTNVNSVPNKWAEKILN
jgi:peptidoglycan/xylan/chitin deacetylase (PgdA/CDA1 family)